MGISGVYNSLFDFAADITTHARQSQTVVYLKGLLVNNAYCKNVSRFCGNITDNPLPVPSRDFNGRSYNLPI